MNDHDDVDEHEIINRREAVGGLSLLGGLTLALLGTIVFRIVQAEPSRRPASNENSVATAVDANGAQRGPSSTVVRQDQDVQPAAHDERATSEERPMFIAPNGELPPSVDRREERRGLPVGPAR